MEKNEQAVREEFWDISDWKCKLLLHGFITVIPTAQTALADIHHNDKQEHTHFIPVASAGFPCIGRCVCVCRYARVWECTFPIASGLATDEHR